MKLFISIFLFFSLFISKLFALPNIKTYEASFTQSIINNSGKEVLYNGQIHIKQPALVLWKYNDPIDKFVYIKNDKVTIIEPELEQAIITKLDKEINLLNLLKNAKEISKDKYESTLYNTQYILTISNDQLTQINYTDEIDNKVKISFENIQQNHKLSKNKFEFMIPFEYDIIRK